MDLTGAGDLFAGGFLDGYIKGKTIKKARKVPKCPQKLYKLLEQELTELFFFSFKLPLPFSVL